MFPRFIWLGCLTSSSEWSFICFCCVSVGWKEAVLVLWATCKHSVWSPDWSCGLAFWRGSLCPFPFGRVTLANYSRVLTLPITTCCTARPTPSIPPYKPSCFCLGNQILAPPHPEHPETPDLSLASCSIVSVLIDFFLPTLPHKGGLLREEGPCMCLLPDACIFSWVNWRENIPWGLSAGFVPCVTDGPIACTCWSVWH